MKDFLWNDYVICIFKWDLLLLYKCNIYISHIYVCHIHYICKKFHLRLMTGNFYSVWITEWRFFILHHLHYETMKMNGEWEDSTVENLGSTVYCSFGFSVPLLCTPTSLLSGSIGSRLSVLVGGLFSHLFGSLLKSGSEVQKVTCTGVRTTLSLPVRRDDRLKDWVSLVLTSIH